MTDSSQALQSAEQLPPPTERIPLLRWMKQNLFNTWYNAVLTGVTLTVIGVVLYGLLTWAFTTAEWAVIPANLKGLLVGPYAWDQLWRVWITLYMIAFLVGLSSGLHSGLVRAISRALVIAPLILAVLPFDWVTRAWILGISLSIAAGFAVGHFGKSFKAAKGLEALFWVLSFPLTIVILIGVGPITLGSDDKWGILFNVTAMLLGMSSVLHGGWVRKITLIATLAAWVLATLSAVFLLPAALAVHGSIIGVTVSLFIGLGLCYVAKNVVNARVEITLWTLPVVAAIVLFTGGFEGAWNDGIAAALPKVGGWDKWGFMLNLLAAVVGIGFSLPIGILLALGRRSELPAIRLVCTLFIEFIRGVPLISLLFMASNMLPLLIPGNFRPDIVIRALVTITAFSAAYMAENVRGGLQSIPIGQVEAANALGLNGVLTTLFIVLPQALRNVIPAIVGQFIALFKDTTLFGFIAMVELLYTARTVYGGNLEWRGTIFELIIFIGLLFWIFCFSMSYISRRIERTLGVGQR